MARWWLPMLMACDPTPPVVQPTSTAPPADGRPTSYVFPTSIPPVLHSTNTVRGHAEECTQALGPIPGFDCLTDAEPVPILVDGVPTSERVDRCDAPSLLEGSCSPYTRVGAKQGRTFDGTPNPDVTFVFTCRSSDTEPPTDEGGVFHDVAMIGHHARTGATCYFQAFPGEETRVRAFPSPLTAGDPPDVGTVDAADVWELPARTAAARCVRCHAADPWVHSPWIDQLVDPADPAAPLVPLTSGTDTPYHIVGEAFADWRMAHFDLPDNDCTSCHRVGTEGCDNFVRYSAGDVSSAPVSVSVEGMPWMPPESPLDPTGWQATWRPHVDELLACCADPTEPSCRATPVWEGFRYVDPHPVTRLPTPPDGRCGVVDAELAGAVGQDVYVASTCGQPDDHDNPCGEASTPDRAVSWVAPATGRYSFDTEGSDFDTVVTLRSTCADGYTFLACNDDGPDALDGHSALTLDVSAGDPLLVVVNGAHAEACGELRLSVTAP